MSGDLIGYARVSTGDQHLDMQIDALTEAGCVRVFTDTISGASSSRPGLDDLLDYIRGGDTLVVWKIDRLGRSVSHLVRVITELKDRQINFKSLTEPFDTTTAGGEFLFTVFSALAQMERSLAQERTKAGLAAARARGKRLGRPPSISQAELDLARQLRSHGASLADLGYKFGVSKTTMHRYLSEPE